ncbi:phage tail tape measure protein [Streptomyces sp. MP131-18]|uniref:phage tail tape measure protein n=1 Tax=Streptomyces sp. MP131-18 TaxID=1857892 RepID=UPI00097C7AFD|nr:phage tail tape measure protein [Streptomyces sp. MP131-18]
MTDELTRAATRAGDNAGDAAGDAMNSSFADRMSGLGESLAGPGAAAGGIAALAFGAGLANAMDTSAANARVSAQLGLTEAEAERVGAVAGDVFTAGFGASMDDAAQAVGVVASSVVDLGSTSDTELNDLSSQALAMADVFEWDVGEAATAAGTAIENGLAGTGQEAFDLLVAAAQALPASMRGDIPAVVQEYSEQFQRLGLDGATAFGLMSQFVQAGGRDIDQAADVIHEFARITAEDTAAAAEAFQGLGLDAEGMLSAIHSGGPEAAAAMGDTLEALRGVEDPAERAELAVALFGDMAGESADALLAMNPATSAASAGLDDVSGAASGVTTAMANDPSQQFTAALRTLGATLGQAVMPVLTTLGNWASSNPALFQAVALAVIGVAAALAIMTAAVWAINLALAANPITWIILGVVAGVALLAGTVALVIVYWDQIVAATTAAWDWVYAKVRGVVQWIVDLFMTWSLPGIIISHWDTIKGAIGTAMDWIGARVEDGVNTVSGWWDTLADLPGKVLGWFSGLGGDIADTIGGGFRGGINAIIRGWNGLSFTVGGGSFLGVSVPSFTLSTPNVPYLAAGGIVQARRGGTLALIGEAGQDEAVIPLDRLEDMLPTVRATVPTGRAAAPAAVVQIVAGDRHLRAWLEEMVRTQLGGDVTRLGRAR